jgi:hypothetical protein
MSSNTRTIDSANHVVLCSMHDNKATKCWLQLLRHGVAFRIDASVDDLEGTPLHLRWQVLFENEDTPGMTIDDRIDRSERLCNLLVETSLPVLEDLAPEIPYDRSLRRSFIQRPTICSSSGTQRHKKFGPQSPVGPLMSRHTDTRRPRRTISGRLVLG